MTQENSNQEINLAKKFTTRNLRDLVTKIIVNAGGGAVFIALGAIFVYLALEVIPLFTDVESKQVSSQQIQNNELIHLSIEEQNQVALTINKSGVLRFIQTESGKVILEKQIADKDISSAYTLNGSSKIYIMLAFADGTAKIISPEYKSIYREGQNTEIVPSITFPISEDDLVLHDDGSKIEKAVFEINEESLSIISISDAHIYLSKFLKEESFLDDKITWEKEQQLIEQPVKPDYIFIDQTQSDILVIENSGNFVKLTNELDIVQQDDFLANESLKIATAETLSSGSSLLIADTNGTITHWFPVRNNKNVFEYTKIRDIEITSSNAASSKIVKIVPEYSRKVAYVYDDQGTVYFMHTTSEQIFHQQNFVEDDIKNFAISPRSNAILINHGNNISLFKVHNEHPEVSFSSLWQKVWYEGYEKPEYIWQSSSSSNDFEPKFSFMPLAFGTIKAAFYAMLFATPIGVLAGAYTAYFMKPSLRRVVKPTVELMAALPTVILGFLAGLWLAPFIEHNLPGIFAVPIIFTFGILALSIIWIYMPKKIREALPEGCEILILIPAIIFFIWLSFYLSPALEVLLFDGNTRSWLTDTMHINFDQRNSIIIGITMGIAVIPNIFSITEDAVFGVPRSLTNGSLALGATPWQTMTRVIVLTASPAIFSAIMIGMGRAIGETMIVLMATGNTPIMDFNIFEGMRTLAANIAVEMPEAEVGSTHFRLLFLSAFALFILTFIFNTLSEIVSTRLRKKYSNL